MPDASLTLDIGGAYPFVEQRILHCFGKDSVSQEEKSWFASLHATALHRTKSVQCVGMPEPIPFEEIYQPTHLFRKGIYQTSRYSQGSKTERSIARSRAETFRPLAFDEFVDSREDAIIYAGPGWGKTTFLHSLFRVLLRTDHVWPILITLSRPGALGDLERIVENASRVQKRANRAQLRLLIDGYDEVKSAERRLVSEAVIKFQALGIGSVSLTCREFYQVYQIVAPEIRLGGFTITDKYKFATAFLKAFSSPLDAIKIVNSFEDRGFSEFLSHPLLLALACIVQTSSQKVMIRSGLKLLDRALNVLSYRWDEHKGIDRESKTPLDGDERIQILQRIAFDVKSTHVPGYRACFLAKQELTRLSYDKPDPKQVLHEIAQFYGILAPSDDGWFFVHRTLQDFLAAQYSVQTGEFARKIRYEWNARTAYAACMMRDATDVLVAALNSNEGLSTAAEILDNSPRLEKEKVASALLAYYSKPNRSVIISSDSASVSGALPSDIISLADTRLLNYIIEFCSAKRSPLGNLVCGYCVFELLNRDLKLDFQTYPIVAETLGTENFRFALNGLGTVSLKQVKPGASSTAKSD
jgi:hypothetical protein